MSDPEEPDPEEPEPAEEDFGIEDWCEGVADAPTFLSSLDDAHDFALLQRIDSPGIKLLARVDGAEPPGGIEEECLFQDMHRFDYHLLFLRQTYAKMSELSMSTYADWVLRSATRRWWGGEVRLWLGTPHPLTGAPGIVTLAVMSDTQEGLGAEELEEVHSRVAGCMPFARELLVLVPSHHAQQTAMLEARASLAEKGIGVVEGFGLSSALPATSYSHGESFGLLRVVEPGPCGEPLDEPGILVSADPPPGASGVGGLLTSEPQDEENPLTEELRSRGVPNAGVAGVFDNGLLRVLDQLPVRLTVSPSQVRVSPANCRDALPGNFGP